MAGHKYEAEKAGHLEGHLRRFLPLPDSSVDAVLPAAPAARLEVFRPGRTRIQEALMIKGGERP
ncbi:MAG: hypothetical protein ACYC0L_02055 [Thermoleophilia bacterium]